MTLAAYHTGTDSPNLAINEDGSGGLLPSVPVGNKTTWAETSRTGLTGADAPTGGDLTTTGFAGTAGVNLIDMGNALAVHLRATCGTASAILTGRLVLYDSSNAAIGVTATLTFTADGTLRLGNAAGNFVCAHAIQDVGGARKCRFFVDTVSAGTWAVYIRPI